NGNTEAGATVVITLAGVVVGQAVADENGDYSVTTDALTDGTHTLTITATDEAGNSITTTQEVTIDTALTDASSLAITNIVDNEGDYSSVTISGTGAEAGNTITIYDEDGIAVAATEVDAEGNWSADISNLSGTQINDNEFFSVTESDTAGNVTAQVDTTHYWHGTYANAETEASDDYVFMGHGNDKVEINDDDINNELVIDGGSGNDTALFDGNYADYTITTNEAGDIVVTESNGDVNELRNIETIEFADGSYDVSSGVYTSFDAGADPVSAEISVGDAVENMTQVVDTEAMAAQGITQGEDGNYYETTYAETAKLMKTETIEVGVAKEIRLDDAPDHGVVEIQGSDGSWSRMVVGQEYSAESNVRFTPDSSAMDATRDIKIGTFGDNIGLKSFTEKADVSDWGEVSRDGKSVTFTDGDLSVTTTVVQNGANQVLGAYNKSGTSDGAGIGDADAAGLSQGETMVVAISGQDVNQVVFQLDGLGGYFDASSSHATQVLVTAYDANGNVIDAQGGYRESGNYEDTYEFTTTVPVARFELTTTGSNGNYVVQNMTLSKTIVDEVKFTAIAEDGTELSVTSDVNIQRGMGTTDITQLLPVSDEPMTKNIKVVNLEAMEAKGAILIDGTWVVETGTQEVEPPMMDVVESYTYPLDITAALSDTDGSETLSVVITGVPEGATLSEGINNGDGTWTITVDEGATSISQSISITVPAGTESFSLGLQATSTEVTTQDSETVSTQVEITSPLSMDMQEEESVEDVAEEPSIEESEAEIEYVSIDPIMMVDDAANDAAGIYQGSDGNYYTNETQRVESDDKSIINKGSHDSVSIQGVANEITIDAKITGKAAGVVLFLDSEGNEIGSQSLSNGEHSYSCNHEFASVQIESTGKSAIQINGYSIESVVATPAEAIMKVDVEAMAELGAVYENGEWLVPSGSVAENAAVDEGETFEYENIQNSSHYTRDSDYTDEVLETGDGSDTIRVNDDIDDGRVVNMNDGDDRLFVGDDLQNGSEVNMGSGDDSVEVGGELDDASINMGEGDDSVNIERIIDESRVDMGDGDDSVTINDVSSSFDGSVDLGAGDDTLTLGDDLKGSEGLFGGGEGYDTLVFEGDMNIDMSALEDNSFSNFESIDLGEGTQHLSLSLDDVLDMTDSDNLLRIDGEAGDTISLDTIADGVGEWTLGDFKTDLETGQTYQEVTGQVDDQTVTVEVSTNITIEH
ncbi:MAG: hypothetical protein IE916_05505, partial [Epsilonproteobacteria bacterium]|nr:hypothetical protein [Campylobacterota bacterium]